MRSERRRMNALIDRYRRVIIHLAPRLVVWLGMLAAVVLLALGEVIAGSLVALAATLVTLAGRLFSDDGDRHLVVRAALASAVGATLVAAHIPAWAAVTSTAALLGALAAESTIDHVTRPALRAWNLPGHRPSTAGRAPEPIFIAGSLSLAVLTLGPLGPPAAALPALVVALLLGGVLFAARQLFRVRRHLPEREIRAALTGYAPSYYLYFNGTAAAGYQVTMWLPYLARTGERGAVVIRDPRFARAALSLTELPVILAKSVGSLEYAVVPSLRAFFYVNNDQKNVHGVRFSELTHVHLGHGDSDKPASYAASFGMFDQIFVAGQAAIDRFAQHGVAIPREKFVLVGRPQVEDIEVRGAGGEVANPVVLYAPTWRGGLEDSLFGSLRYGERIVAELLAAGATVLFRPHPYSWRDAESRVLIGRIDAMLAADAARPHARSGYTSARTVFACMNSSDAMITDVSSVASDYLYSNKPFALTDTGVVDDLEAAYPLARAAVLLPVGGDFSAALADLLGQDSRRVVRAEVRRYYLGDWPPEEYAGVFVAAARAAITRGARAHQS
jgi:hypothetical protein